MRRSGHEPGRFETVTSTVRFELFFRTTSAKELIKNYESLKERKRRLESYIMSDFQRKRMIKNMTGPNMELVNPALLCVAIPDTEKL